MHWTADEISFVLGGDLGGAVDDTIFLVTMQIDHVCVWQAPA